MWRRSVVQGLGLLPAALLLPKAAQATLVSGLTLTQLVRRSGRVVVLRALDSTSRRVLLGGKSCVVTDSRVQVEDVLLGAASAQELTVRTLGGRIGNQGELVLGQPALSSASHDVAFLTNDVEGVHWFVGMAQGHYPLRASNTEPILEHSRNLPEIRELSTSAVKALHGLGLSAARRAIREAEQR